MYDLSLTPSFAAHVVLAERPYDERTLRMVLANLTAESASRPGPQSAQPTTRSSIRRPRFGFRVPSLTIPAFAHVVAVAAAR